MGRGLVIVSHSSSQPKVSFHLSQSDETGGSVREERSKEECRSHFIRNDNGTPVVVVLLGLQSR
jgi:hypothetical protein